MSAFKIKFVYKIKCFYSCLLGIDEKRNKKSNCDQAAHHSVHGLSPLVLFSPLVIFPGFSSAFSANYLEQVFAYPPPNLSHQQSQHLAVFQWHLQA